ncbi:unnamed protein product [Ostreobium quekettii]|uniref:7-dehydrocholesterol reductase n=1 Tax=Ostreobium quekettii TaxID=121088 RepID=A0A8S1IVP7_9CHLO|nr:unnamed protein product [Ostreobium quekettii]|eukprot:evm.model.scf_339EXC.8 EVM.evm.TU.scf_339EXC.8   scf_339EXC:42269-47292(-)
MTAVCRISKLNHSQKQAIPVVRCQRLHCSLGVCQRPAPPTREGPRVSSSSLWSSCLAAPSTGLTMTAKGDKEGQAWANSDGTGRKASVWGVTGTAGEVLSLMGTLFLLTMCPAFIMFMWTIHSKFGGSLQHFASFAMQDGWQGVIGLLPSPTRAAWIYFAVFGIFEAALQLLLPGKTTYGPVTPKGNVPVYKANGVAAYVTTLMMLALLWRLDLFNPAQVYDKFGEILMVTNIFALGLCVFLNVKGLVAPSSTDSGSTGNIIYNFWWGTELYPRIGKHFDIKVWTNCRMGMVSWGVIILCFAAKQYEALGYVADSMVVSVLIMEVYIFKFFLWESSYMKTMDIAHDRAGYYLCWGCLNWVPGVYTSPAMFLVGHPVELGLPLAATMAVVGLAFVYINYDADRQRQAFRAEGGKGKIWGKTPKKVEAQYVTADNEIKTSLLLASGWWGLARHFHYVPEIMASVFWTLPGLFSHPLHWFYVVYLILLLLDRGFRDDQRCRSKYGKYWDRYCEIVKYRIIPGIY